jgi:uncharacterized protein YgbK (DUF1537 family)
MQVKKIVVLDDDPTGAQTVQDVVVLTTWEPTALLAELLAPAPLFFILTNTRAMPESEARERTEAACRNLQWAAAEAQVTLHIINRGDSTLRGHFPAEPEAIEAGLGQPFDAWLLIPFFEEGGRITRDDIHYVREGGVLIPAGETPFARDATFGYQSSNLRDWVAEKTGGAVPASAVVSISRTALADVAALTALLAGLPPRCIAVVNAEAYADLLPLARAVWALPHRRLLVRAAASWVKAMKTIADGLTTPVPLIFPTANTLAGGLIVVGSHVPKTTGQLRFLLDHDPHPEPVEIAVNSLLNPDSRADYLTEITARVQQILAAGRHVVLFTSRELVSAADPVHSLRISQQVSAGLVTVVQQLQVQPRFLIAKGGITASDIATDALSVRRVVVRGQLQPGVPVWETGPESRFPGLWYIVFPGNVGDEQALHKAFLQIS